MCRAKENHGMNVNLNFVGSPYIIVKHLVQIFHKMFMVIKVGSLLICRWRPMSIQLLVTSL
jgi:hypothetical protein